MDKQLDLSIVIVSWNVADKLEQNLEALYRTENGLSFEIFVVDNDSSDNTVNLVKDKYPQVRLIANRTNYGFARACNQGVSQAQGRYILLLNPDMRVFPETLPKMVYWLDEHPLVDLAGCKLLDEQGGIVRHVRRFPAIWDQLAIVLKLPHIFPRVLSSYLSDDFDYEKASQVDSIRGSFFMMRRPTEGLPLLDERYFLWFEEVDFCRQIRQRGGQVWYTPTAQCIDLVGASFSQVKRGMTQIYFESSMLKYFLKWHPLWQYLLLKISWPIGKALVRAADMLKIKSRTRT
jgi:N-acetylglucosaminyl-diphospho-decaprenol L-rhamnosyltransferase